ncbi:glycoside hydrolase [Longimonas halophila]|uniref:Glycoside hydrolase n=1 Tax=Longimonas halophila TaxID=1469170 RepID=A0A2H3NNY1_9BACT|nr:glycoside hydrolase family 43 protein [Longimonas halophila]PEN08726.1 glycoside hydrolase [Longimonas halophila]
MYTFITTGFSCPRGVSPGLSRPAALLVVVLALGSMTACDKQAPTMSSAEENDEREVDGPAYENPVLGRDFPDPAVLQGPDGTYYAYATETLIDGTFYNIQVATSETLVDWTWEGDAMPTGVDWAEEGRSYWAPHVVYAPEQHRYIMYFSAHHDQKDTKCLATATSENPLGPFQHDGEPLRCGDGFKAIDPMALDDPESGTSYLYWGSHGEPIRAQPLSDSRTEFEDDTEPTAVVHPNPDAPYGGLIEGAWTIYRDSTYYLFYSGDNCCGENAHYAVMVARADNPTGPFITRGEAQGTARSTILTANDTWKAPGHNSVIRDADGTDWMVYHAINRAQPTRPTGTGMRWDRRVMLMDRIVYEEGWPRIENASPSTASPIPATAN